MLKGIHQYSQSQCDWQWDGPDPNKIQLKKKTTTTEWKCGGRGGDSPSWNTFLSCSDMSPVCCCQWTVAQSQVLSWQLEIIMEIILQIRTLSVCECFCPPPDNSWTLAGVSECRQCSSRRKRWTLSQSGVFFCLHSFLSFKAGQWAGAKFSRVWP